MPRLFGPHVGPARPVVVSILAVLLTAGLLTGCGDDEQPGSEPSGPTTTGVVRVSTGADGIQQASFDMGDYEFSGPTQLSVGPTRVTAVNKGNEMHQLTIGRIMDGHTYDEVTAAVANLASDPLGVENLLTFVGGVNAVDPGGSGTAEIQLDQPGDYAVLCFIPDLKGVSHLTHGMVRPLTVNASSATPAELAAPDSSIALTDFAYSAIQPKGGPQRVEFTNAGTESHEAILVRLGSGKTFDDLLGWFARLAGGQLGPSDPAPGNALGGVAAISPGVSSTVDYAELPPGNYVYFCAIAGKDMTPHVLKGMKAEFTIS